MQIRADDATAPAPAAPLALRWRLSLLIGVLLTATLAIAAVVAVQGAREAVQREVGSSLQTAEANLDMLAEVLAGVPPDRVHGILQRWEQGYAGGRHLCIAVSGVGTPLRGCEVSSGAADVPAWFSLGADAVIPPVSRDIATSRGTVTVRLVSDPRDELREAWVDVRALLGLIGALAFVVNLCVFVALSRGLRPLGDLMRAMDELGRGLPLTPLAEHGAHEMQVLSRGLQAMAERLRHSREAVRRLHLRNLDLQEDERKMVARELHDEIGHHVAAIEMETIRIGRLAPDEEAQRQQRLAQLRTSIAEIHRVSRNLLHRLRPPAIESLGLAAAIEAMLNRWQADHPEAVLRHDIESDADRLLAPRAVHLYRIVQEAMSNVARHARPAKVWVSLELQAGQALLQIVDDGSGFDPDAPTAGFGLVGMRERVEALAGQIQVRTRRGAGTIVEVSIPILSRAPRRPSDAGAGRSGEPEQVSVASGVGASTRRRMRGPAPG